MQEPDHGDEDQRPGGIEDREDAFAADEAAQLGEIAQRLGWTGRRRPRGPTWSPRIGFPKRRGPSASADNIDSILDKISAKGYENLTPTEKKILENYSRQQREEPEE